MTKKVAESASTRRSRAGTTARTAPRPATRPALMAAVVAAARAELHANHMSHLDAESFARWCDAWARDHGPRERTARERTRLPGARAATRGDLVDLAARQFAAWTVREVALLAIVAGFPVPARVGMTPLDVIAREVKSIRSELARQVEDGNAKRRPLEGRRGRPRKQPSR